MPLRYEDVITLADTILANEGGCYVEETYYYKGWALLYSDTPGAITNLELALECQRARRRGTSISRFTLTKPASSRPYEW